MILTNKLIGSGVILLGSLYWCWYDYTIMRRKSTIKLKPEEEVPKFWTANRDKII